ncbi:MAG: hypothetical protein COB79_02900 [Zetaproteobacteria bacterium]|nr:MAG: hypothetical protein COB79_02900 [Zetaproteobacteria bacterium]
MDNNNHKVFIEAVQGLKEQFNKKQNELKYQHAFESFVSFEQVVTDKTFKQVWSAKHYTLFAKNLELDQKSEAYRFRANISLAYILKAFGGTKTLKGMIKTNRWPKVNFYPRPNLALNKNEYDFSDVELFERILVLLCQDSPNNRAQADELCLWLTLRLIAIEGVVIGDADKNISQLKIDDIHENDKAAWIGIPVGRKDIKSHKQYPVTQATIEAIKKLKRKGSKSKDVQFLFPESWRIATDKKKTKRRLLLEDKLNSLCYVVDPEHPRLGLLDMKWWIQMSRQSMEVGGIPYLCMANMSNKIRIAQLKFDSKKERKVQGQHLTSLVGSAELKLLRKLQSNFKSYIDIKQANKAVKTKLKCDLERTLVSFDGIERIPTKWKQLFDWFVFLVDSKEFSDLEVPTLYIHTYSIVNRVFEYVEADDMRSLSEENWLDLARKVSRNEMYKASTRTTAISHLRRFYDYLYNHESNVPLVHWEQANLDVHRQIAEGCFVTHGEFETLLSKVPEGSAEWVALFMSFHGGLRCEEIFNLKKQDFDDLERVPVLRSKTSAGYRVIPLASFLDSQTEKGLRKIINLTTKGESRILSDYESIKSPKDLSKKVSRLMAKLGHTNLSLHTFRHSFASLQLMKYFVLIEPELKEHLLAEVPEIPRRVLEGSQMEELAHVFGGMKWLRSYQTLGVCHPSPTDLCDLSKLLGHTSRQTTLENYCNSFFWLQRYWVLKREAKLMP